MLSNGSKNGSHDPAKKQRKVNGSGVKDGSKVGRNSVNDLEFEGGAKVAEAEKSLDEMLKDD